MKRTAFPRLVPVLAAACLSFAPGEEAPKITDFQLQPGVEVRLAYTDAAPGGVRYVLEASDDLEGWTEIGSGLPGILGKGWYDMAAALGALEDQKFYRVRAVRETATLGFELDKLAVDEGSGEQQIVVRFVDAAGQPLIYNGPVAYEWTGAAGLVSQLTGSVEAGGTEVAIPVTIGENLGTESLRQLVLKLSADTGSGYVVDPVAATSTVTIRENDNYWRGSFQTDAELLDLELFVRIDGATLLVFLTEGTAFLESGFALADSPEFSPTTFHAAFPEVAMASTPENLLAPGTVVQLTLDADEANPGEVVTSTEISGRGTLVIHNPSKSHLTTSVAGSFLIRQDPPLQPTDDLNLEVQP